MTRLIALALAALTALPASAAEPLSAEAFESYVTGKTLTYGMAGQSYGIEEYLSDRRVRWSFLDGKCKEGTWYEATNGQICFVYDDDPEPQCWSFFADGGKLRAVFGSEPGGTVLYEAQSSDEPMLCLGPDVGV